MNLSSKSSPNFLNHFTHIYKHLLLCLLASGRTLTFPLPPSLRTAAAKAQDFLSSKNLPPRFILPLPLSLPLSPPSPLPPNPLLSNSSHPTSSPNLSHQPPHPAFRVINLKCKSDSVTPLPTSHSVQFSSVTQSCPILRSNE